MNFVLAGRTVVNLFMRVFGPVKAKMAVPVQQAAQNVAQQAGETVQQAGQTLQDMGQQYGQTLNRGYTPTGGPSHTQTVSGRT